MEKKNLPQKKQLVTAGVMLSENYIIQAANKQKIREYSEPEKEKSTGALINYLLALLGISSVADDQKEMHYIALDDFINDSLKHYSYEEIKIAFKNFIKGDYGFQAYNKLDSIIAGKVMKAYDNAKSQIITNEKIKVVNEYKFEPLTNSEKDRIMLDAIDRVKKEVIETGTINGTAHHVYDFMIKTGRMNDPEPEIKRACMKIALREQKEDIERFAKSDYQLKKQLKRTIKALGSGNERTIKIAKTLALKNYFLTLKIITDEKKQKTKKGE